ncbi:hypothetical protein [Pseudomonas sp. URIL14HWK12:I7]|uniref:hypothetical protein n=1 Tax=Pseudomonas sp. URIL14HWK12:I7 TaxID=1283285 RepID=UPI00047F91CF|nr:hypothetical protein [Pseudomonas sp. URIL14HWK12:I7]
MEQDTSLYKTPTSQPANKESRTGLNQIFGAIKSRVCKDFMALPFLTAWSLLICLLLENISNEKVNSFLVSTFGEGIGLRTIWGLLILALLITGLAWIIRPKAGKFVYTIFLAPVKAARSTCVTTIAFFLGLIIAIAITNGMSKAADLLPALGILCASWIALNCTECLVSEASNNREEEYRKFFIPSGIVLVLGSCYVLYFFYNQIKSGAIT